jgi:hypothetical protein
MVEDAWVSVQIGDCDPMVSNFTLDPKLSTPTDIVAYALEVCPIQSIELNVEDNNAPYPSVNYQWQVLSGGSLGSGQGSPVIFVNTSNVEYGMLMVRVRVKNKCGFSDWFTISIPFDRNCRSGDGVMRRAIVEYISVFPNPTHDYITIDGAGDNVKSKMFSINGHLIISSTVNTIDASNLKAGMYLLTVEQIDGTMKTFKLSSD